MRKILSEFWADLTFKGPLILSVIAWFLLIFSAAMVALPLTLMLRHGFRGGWDVLWQH